MTLYTGYIWYTWPMSRRRRFISSDTESSNVNQLTTLSLFIMLLAFFIVLTSRSNYELEKTQPVIQSIERTFAAKVVGKDKSQSSSVEDPNQSFNEGNVFEQLNAFFKAEFPKIDTKKASGEDTMSAKIPKADFLRGLQESSPSSLKLRDLLNRYSGTSKSYVMEVTFHFTQDPARSAFNDPQAYRKTLREAEELIEKMETIGFSSDTIALNFIKGDPSDLTLVFRDQPGTYTFTSLSGRQNASE